MPKDTKSLDNNKAPACESRGFVHKKKEGVHFDTPSFPSGLYFLEIIAYTHSKHGLIHVFDDVVFQIQTDRELARGIELTT